MSDEQQIAEETPAPGRRGLSAEWLKFLLFSVILLLVVLVVALSRPLIFGRLIPAVLGENLTRATLQEEETDPVKDELPTGDAEEPIAEDDAPVSGEVPDTEEEAGEEEETGAAAPTAVPAQTHTVARGEHLTGIARQYNVTVEALIAANDIQNPNQLFVGDVLVIPQP